MIEFVLSGPEAEAQADIAAREWTAIFGYRPKSRKIAPDPASRDARSTMTVALMIPAAVVATLDLVQRVKMIGVLRNLIDRLPPGIIARRGDRTVMVDTEHMRAVLDLAADTPIEPLYDVFLSTTDSEGRTGDALAAALRDHGLRVFWPGDAMPDDIWPTALWNAQRNARATVTLISRVAPTRWDQDETLIGGIRLERPWRHGFIPVYPGGLPRRPANPPRGVSMLRRIDLKTTGPQRAAWLVTRGLHTLTREPEVA